MRITNWYRGITDLLSGFVFDTNTKTYKVFQLKAAEWTEDGGPKAGFKNPADISYYFSTKTDMESKLKELVRLGFTEDVLMVLDFGVTKR